MLWLIAVQRQQIYLPEGERAVLYCNDSCGPIRRSLFTWFFNGQPFDLQRSSVSRYFLFPLYMRSDASESCVNCSHLTGMFYGFKFTAIYWFEVVIFYSTSVLPQI